MSGILLIGGGIAVAYLIYQKIQAGNATWIDYVASIVAVLALVMVLVKRDFA